MTQWGQDRLLRLRVGDIRWEILPGMEDHLIYLLEELDRSRRSAQEPPGVVNLRGVRIFKVKTNRPGLAGELFVKVYPARGLARTGLKAFASPARREWIMAHEHGRRGLPTSRHLAFGIKRKGTEEYLVQESLTGYESFPEYFRTTFLPDLPGGGPHEKRRLIRDLASLMRRMHDRGISRRDLEPANIMAAPRSGGGVSFVFVDLSRSRLRRDRGGFKEKDRTLELARFHKSFSPFLSQSYRIRFYREYFSPDNLGHEAFTRMVKRIVVLSHELARKEEKEVVKAIRRRVAPYFWFDLPDGRVHLTKPLYQNSMIEVARKLKAGEQLDRVRVKRLGGESPLELSVGRIEADDGHPRGMGGPAGWSFLLSALLEHHGVAHYKVKAAIESRPQAFILRRQPGRGDYNLAEHLARRVAEEFSGLSWDRKFLIRVARFLLKLHEIGFYYDVMSGDDIWVRTTESETHEIRLHNLHKLRRLERLALRPRLRNLFELWKVLPISQSDGLMLAEEYLRFSPAPPDQRKHWLRIFMEWQMDSVIVRDHQENKSAEKGTG